MSYWRTMVVAFALAGIAPGAGAQTGDPERTRQQEALAHAVVIQTAWRSVQERIGVTDAANLWENEWSGLVDPSPASWWLASWTGRGLTARYCDGVLAVYATSDALKGVQRDHREVQVAPARYGGGRTGLHMILANSRIAVGAHGRDDETLPVCMTIPSTTGDRVGLVSAVADPIRTVTGFRWNTETRDVDCASDPSVKIREARRMPIQLTSIRGGGETRGRDLAVTDPGNLDIWPSDCGLRAGLGPEAQCTDWKRVGGQCPHVFAQAAAPQPIPDPVITCTPAADYERTVACCPSGETGSCTEYYKTWNREFQVRPGAPVVSTRRGKCVDSTGATFGSSTGILAGREENCTPIPVNPPPSCPPGQTGTPPNCVTPVNPPPSCPPGQTGTPPNCVTPVNPPPSCPPGQTGTPPNCKTPVDPPKKCPPGQEGTPPNCREPDNDSPDGNDGNDGNEDGVDEDDSANEGFGGSSLGPPGSDGVSTNGGDGDGDSGCFLTTAMVEMRGEADDGPTLTAMRRFRDTYMQATPERREMVEGYYRVAPAIVAAIPKDHPDWVWLERKIDASASAFRRGENDLAFEIMAGAVHRLHDRWLVEGDGEQQDG